MRLRKGYTLSRQCLILKKTIEPQRTRLPGGHPLFPFLLFFTFLRNFLLGKKMMGRKIPSNSPDSYLYATSSLLFTQRNAEDLFVMKPLWPQA
ncbi:hypothetical protein SCARR_02541 [Pontiella sulfatireligans]|uniref:Uncharacterized protein n=1 Tax=Pontiella sulfatireligans TaxID=2750658 RepID=A0A6C2UK50_9BACT|nr:hypothetical protein SCARR_02541 [Pontiella sulfatireligans]